MRIGRDNDVMSRADVLLVVLVASGCSPDIYVRDGVTDGDTFYLAEYALADPDPVLQSWVRYSLIKSTCQLEIGGSNPARASSFACELKAREHLLGAWAEQHQAIPGISDAYLDDLSRVAGAEFLDEYVVRYFGRSSWTLPPDLDQSSFKRWQRRELPGHKPQTRLIGSWSYAGNAP